MSSRPDFLLYRILGNSLPPRHRDGEMLENLRFILQHEPALQGCEKRWVLNRISDAAIEQACIRLIDAAGQRWLRIPFELDQYAHCFLDASAMPVALLPFVAREKELTLPQQGIALEWQYRHKSRYAIPINLARNLALDEGRQEARWTLPWDGSCFLTATAWQAVRKLAASHDRALHLAVPMARITDNQHLLRPDFVPAVLTEPQLVFRNDSCERFDASLRYGHRDKSDLLRQLGVPGPWQKWSAASWDAQTRRLSPEHGRFLQGAWVARLASQGAGLDADDTARWYARLVGVKTYCQQLDARVVDQALRQRPLLCYSADKIQAASASLKAEIVRRAQTALAQSQPTILNKTVLPPSGDAHDYISLSPYSHVDAEGNLSWRDGERSAVTVLFSKESAAYDCSALEHFIQTTCAAALAGAVSGEAHYFQAAAARLRAWFVDPATRMNPHLRYAQVLPREPLTGQVTGVVEFRNLWPLLDAIRLTAESGALSEEEHAAIRRWLRAFLQDVVDRRPSRHLNNLSTWADLLIAAIAAYTGDTALASRVLTEAPLRVAAQLSAFSAPHLELVRTRPLHYSLFHLQAWMALATLGRKLGVDLWKYSASMERNIVQQARFVALNKACLPDYAAQAVAFEQWTAAALRCIPSDAVRHDLLQGVVLSPTPDIFDAPDSGMPPFWPALSPA